MLIFVQVFTNYMSFCPKLHLITIWTYQEIFCWKKLLVIKIKRIFGKCQKICNLRKKLMRHDTNQSMVQQVPWIPSSTWNFGTFLQAIASWSYIYMVHTLVQISTSKSLYQFLKASAVNLVCPTIVTLHNVFFVMVSHWLVSFL